MKTLLKCFLLLAFFLAGFQSIRAQTTTTGNKLREQCAAAIRHEMSIDAGLCIGFINGYQQVAVMLPPSANVKLACWPDGATPDQIAKIVVKYLDAHPEKLHLPATQLIYDATYEVFPCPANPK
jgi:hypothetical protein